MVFNTAITGYQEILTDPSYAKQIVTLTHPHVGNVGTNKEDEESENIWASGLVIRDLPKLASNYRSQQSLNDYLESKGIIAISDIDTRMLTRKIRQNGAMNGCILAGKIKIEEAKRLEGIILPLRQQGKSLRVICNVLNETGITTSRGKAFHPSKVKRTLSILEVA